ncbi:MAG: Ku protein [Planctomycetota bacterium]|nr:MAG: Ku protein [Planctomycetota bacterium]
MPARSMWNGELAIGAHRVAVKLYAAVEDRGIRFHLLHDHDHVRLQQRMVNPTTNETVALANARKGFEVERGVFVLLEENLEALEPKPSREIAVSRFVASSRIAPQRYLRPYFLGPHGSDDDYFALAAALDGAAAAGIAHWVMRKKEYTGALRAEGGYLMLHTLREPDEVIAPDQLDPPEGRELETKELRLAEQLIGALESDLDPRRYRDEYSERVRQLIRAKRRGESIEVREYERRPETGSLAEMLRESVKRTQAKPKR